MRLKARPNTGYRMDVCAATRCGASAANIVAADTYFELERGEVPLCAKHHTKLLELEREGSNADAATENKPTVNHTGQWLQPQEQAALQAEATDAQDALREIEAFEIASQEDYDFADELLGDAKTNWKDLESRKKRAVGPLNEALKEIRSWFSAPQQFYKQAENLLKSKLLTYVRAQEAEQDRLLAAAEQAHAVGDAPAVGEAVRAAATTEVAIATHTTIRELWGWEIENEALIPREYLVPDSVRITNEVVQYQGQTNIPGIRPVRRDSMIRRTG
jgi:hypothetical protein